MDGPSFSQDAAEPLRHSVTRSLAHSALPVWHSRTGRTGRNNDETEKKGKEAERVKLAFVTTMPPVTKVPDRRTAHYLSRKSMKLLLHEPKILDALLRDCYPQEEETLHFRKFLVQTRTPNVMGCETRAPNSQPFCAHCD